MSVEALHAPPWCRRHRRIHERREGRRARSSAYDAMGGEQARRRTPDPSRSCSLNRAIEPAGLQARDGLDRDSGHVSQYVVGNGAPSASTGALRITSGCPPVQRATTVNGVVGSRPSCSRTAVRSTERSSRWDVPGPLIATLILAGPHATIRARRHTGVRMPADHDFTELRTERLVIRPFRPKDVEAFAAYRADPDVARYQSWERTSASAGRGVRRRHVDRSIRVSRVEWFQFAVADAERATTLIGDTALCVDPDDPFACRARVHVRAARIKGRDTRRRPCAHDRLRARTTRRRRRGGDHRRAQCRVHRAAGTDRDVARRHGARSRSRAHGATEPPMRCAVESVERCRATCACARRRACSRPSAPRSDA